MTDLSAKHERDCVVAYLRMKARKADTARRNKGYGDATLGARMAFEAAADAIERGEHLPSDVFVQIGQIVEASEFELSGGAVRVKGTFSVSPPRIWVKGWPNEFGSEPAEALGRVVRAVDVHGAEHYFRVVREERGELILEEVAQNRAQH